MKNVPQMLSVALLCSFLASCASSTMDSIPTAQELEAYEKVVRTRYQNEYAVLSRQLSSGAISKATYEERKRALDSQVTEEVNDAAWNKHFLAESERKADGVPTPDQPVGLNPGQAQGAIASYGALGGNMGSFYQPMTQQNNFGLAQGMSGSAGMGSMRAANEQFKSAQTVRNDAVTSGGTILSAPPRGSIYDTDLKK